MKTIFCRFGMLLLIGWMSLGLRAADSDYTLTYIVTPDTVGRYLCVELDYESQAGDAPDDLLLKMPVWAPGYYLIVDFPKYLTDFAVVGEDSRPLVWSKTGKNGWRIERPGRRFRATYRIFANERSVAECRVEHDRAFVAPNGVFMYVDGDKEHSVEVTYRLPENWQRISTGLKPVAGEANTFFAPDFDVLYDSPALMGNHFVMTFTHEGHDYEFALETPDGFDESPFLEDFKKMVSAATRLMGHVPYDNYCLIHLGQGQGGLEHANSQACYTDGTFRFSRRDDYLSYLLFTTHEYFHLYNVKSIRPVELGPFDYDREVLTPMLWVSEGFTVYYETQLLLRAGLMTPDEALQQHSEFLQTVEGNEGHRHMSLRQSSYDIWLNFFNRAENGRDVRISYYDKGPTVALLFDIEIRRMTKGRRSLDDLMRLLYNRFFLDLKRGFTEDEFWAAAEEVAGGRLTQIRRYVDTTDEIDYESYLSDAGLQLDRSTWVLSRNPHPSAAALAFRRSMYL